MRFETRATGPGPVKNLRADDPELVPADPVASLAWEDWLATADEADPLEVNPIGDEETAGD